MSAVDTLLGATVRDGRGDAVGTVTALLIDPDGLAARWLEVALAAGGAAVLPVRAASADAAGSVRIPFTAADLRSAPRVEGATVTRAAAVALLHHYGFPPEIR